MTVDQNGEVMNKSDYQPTSQGKTDLQYEPTTCDLKEAFVKSLESEIANFKEAAIKDLDFFCRYEDRIYTARESLSNIWSLLYSYKKTVIKPEVK